MFNWKTAVAVTIIAAVVGMPSLVQAKEKHSKEGKSAQSFTFQVPATCTISTPDKPSATLADIKAGDKVGVAYDDNNGTLTASKVRVVGPKGSEKEKGHKKGDKGSSVKHAHGSVTSVDTVANTLTISGHSK